MPVLSGFSAHFRRFGALGPSGFAGRFGPVL